MLSRATKGRWLTGRRLTVAAALLAVLGLLITYVVTTRPSSLPSSLPSSPPSSLPTSPVPTTPTASPHRSDRVLLNATFDDDQLDSAVWSTCHWWADGGCTIATNNELEWYLPGQVSVADGALRLTADRSPVTRSEGESYEFRSGMVSTGPPPGDEEAPAKLAFTYGSVEARLRVPEGRGLWPAVWLLPASRETLPEIDMLESMGQDPRHMLMYLHPKDPGAKAPNKEYRVRGPNLAEDWHTIRLDWAAGRLDFFVDGVRVWQVTGRHVPDEPMYVVLNLAVGGDYPGPPDADTQFPATFAIDYLRITAG